MATEIETVVWCPNCKVDKYDVLRVPTGNAGVYEHRTNPPEKSGVHKCECGANLERKA